MASIKYITASATAWAAIVGSACAEWPAPRPLRSDRLAEAGVRLVEARHATLVTDAAPSPEVDALPKLIDLAIEPLRQRFDVKRSQTNGWRLRVYLVEDESLFRSLGLWPDQSPDFQHGLSLGYEVWVRQQRSDYYRRHLLLHEATHSFMSTLLGSCGPGWYMEGMAELCGTHSWDGQTLRLGVMPASSKSSPDWGRVRLVRDAERPLAIDAVMKIDNRVALPTESYAWTWALCWFLDNHPAYRERFAKAKNWVTSDQFDRRFRRMYATDRRRLDQEWRLFATTLSYGHDLQREAIDFTPPPALAGGGSPQIHVAASRGWQPTGVRVEQGKSYRIESSGRFTIGHEPDGTPWPCEPGGVSIDWHAGQPVGKLLATVDSGPGALVESAPIGLGAVYRATADGQLFLRLNDSPDSLAENQGEAVVVIHRGADEPSP